MLYIALAGVNPAARIMAAASCEYSVRVLIPRGCSMSIGLAAAALFFMFIFKYAASPPFLICILVCNIHKAYSFYVLL